MQHVLTVNQLTKKFKHIAVNNISFQVEKGNVYGILGPNGSGKSTTLGMLLTTINPTAGQWQWFDHLSTTPETLKKIGAIIEQPNFYPYLTAVQNLKIVCTIKGLTYDQIDRVLDLVSLSERKNDKFSTYSLGMKQRLSIASALLNEPEVLILDEPTNGLDPEGIIQIRELIMQIAKTGTTILVASHMLDEIEKICSHVIILKNGTSLYVGAVDEMTASKGFFELDAEDQINLQKALEDSGKFGKIIIKNDKVKAFIDADFTALELNKYLASKGIYLTHLVKAKESLESQFLDIVKQN